MLTDRVNYWGAVSMKPTLKTYIQFFVENNRFVLSAKDVISIVPLVSLHDVPKAPEYVAGILNYHGISVPVIDLTSLMSGRRTNQRLSTRIVLLSIALPDGKLRTIGIMAEKVTEVMRLDESLFKKSGVKNENARYLGDVITDSKGILQRLTISELVPETERQMLFE